MALAVTMMAGVVLAVAVLAVEIIWVIRRADMGATEQEVMVLVVPLVMDKMRVLNQET